MARSSVAVSDGSVARMGVARCSLVLLWCGGRGAGVGPGGGFLWAGSGSGWSVGE